MPSTTPRVIDARGPLDVRALLCDAQILIVGGTGFLGKVFLSLLLHRFRSIGRVHLVVRPKAGLDSEARFWAEIAPSPVFDPLRREHPGRAFEALLRDKVHPIPGDVSQPFAGVPIEVRHHLRGHLAAVINAAGVVDFNPPLDDALGVNAFGMQSLVSLCRDLGDVPVLHTSTCFVAGIRTGQVDEIDPREHPFPNAGHLEGSHWDPEQEIRECVDVVEHVRHRAQDTFRQSAFLHEAKENLRAKGEPERGTALQDELARVRRKYVEKELARAGTERAHHWGWPNTYTYTKSIGEQILMNSGLRCAINRPAVIESSLEYPVPGWNEGITTSAPIMYLSMQGMTGMPSSEGSVLDVIPVDTTAAGMILALAELLDDSHRPVYQLGTSDVNPLPMKRLIELTGLYKRRHYGNKSSGNPFMNWVQSQYETVPITAEHWKTKGAARTASRLQGVSRFLRQTTKKLTLLEPLTGPTARLVDTMANASAGTHRVIDQYVPFTALNTYVFSCRNVRDALARVPEDQAALLSWNPEALDWRHYLMEVHLPGVEELVWPRIEKRLHRPRKPLRSHDDLVALLDQVADRHEHAPALLLRHPDGFARVTYAELRDRARVTAATLAGVGIEPGDRVLLSGANHPDWVVAYFGILLAGAVAVPVDPELTPPEITNIARTASIRAAVLGPVAEEHFGEVLEPSNAPDGSALLRLAELTAPGDPTLWREVSEQPGRGRPPSPDQLASILFTSGTTGEPKGVMLTHGNFCALLAALARVFDIGADDRVLSVLPLHHTFEFTCGLLLPLSQGARVAYLDELTGDALGTALGDGRVTAMIGVPALWQLLERRINAQVRARGPFFTTAFDAALELNRMLGRTTGLDMGRLLFGVVHQQLGGNIRMLVSGGAALPADTHRFFSGLGLPLAEGYGLTEAAPVLAVANARPGGKPGGVGVAIPGVDLRISEPDADGVGEVQARGPNVMAGYFRNEAATAAAMTDDGWLRTGDLGRLDGRGRLKLVGRAKDVVVTSSGENVHLDDVEQKLGKIAGVDEFSLVGLPDPKGGERLGLLAVPEASDSELGRQAANTRARKAIREAAAALPGWSRPGVVHLVDAPLPRTATRKVKRNEVRDTLARIEAATARPAPGPDGAITLVRHALAQVSGVTANTLDGSSRLAEDLRFDSLMWVELSAALDQIPGARPGIEALARCETVGDIEALVAAEVPALAEGPDAVAPVERMVIPQALVPPLKKALREGQRAIYDRVLDVSVSGRAFIPQNRSCIVVSNHASHLDFGLVKTALGPYGEGMVGLAARDYFFEGNGWWVAYFEQLTNLQSFDRSSSFRQSLRQAAGAIRSGHVVALLPQGGRQADGLLKEFKPLIGKLVLETNTDVLPMWLDGTHAVLPKGGRIPRVSKPIHVRIGPPLPNARLRELGLTPDRTRGQGARVVSSILHDAVEALGRGSVLDLDSVERWELPDDAPVDPLPSLFAELAHRFLPDGVERPLTWYFSLGGDRGRWTVRVAPAGGDTEATCTVTEGRADGQADCVIKTAGGLWIRMVREAWVPDISDFMGGTIKTNDVELLMTFARCFRLGPEGLDGPSLARSRS